MNRVALTVLALLALPSGSVMARGDAAAGKSRSATCVACHGANGISPTDAWPNLAGQGYGYLVKQLQAFRDGTRKDPLMLANAKPLTDQDIENLAAFFAAQTATAAVASRATLDSYDSGSDTDAQSRPAATAAVPHAPIITSPEFIVPRMHPTRQYWADKLPAGEGRATIVQKCQLCHDLQRSIAFARPRQQWQQVMDSMIRRGSPVTPEEGAVLVNYFTRHFGPDSPPIPEVGIKACKPGEWPKGSSDFRRNWKGAYNIWVSNQQGTSIDIVDPVTRKTVSRINCVNAPDRVEFSRDGNTAYAPSRVEHNVTVIDTRTGAIKAKIPLLARPNTAALSRDYKKLYVGIWPVTGDEDKRGYLQVIDTASLKVVKNIKTKGGIHDPWMSADGKLLLSMSPPGRFLDAYDTSNDKLLWTCCHDGEIGTMNMETGADGSTSRVFYSHAGFYGVVAVDAKTGKELKRVEHPVHADGPFKGIRHQPQTGTGSGFHGGEISPDGKNYWVMAGSFLYRYELPSLKSLGDVHLALIDQMGKPFTPAVEGTWMTISPDGQKIYAVRPGRNLLSVVDVKTMKEEALIPTGEYPLHISIWPRGTP